MLNLARALNPVLARPEQATALLTDHVFLAMVAHLAVVDASTRGLARRGNGIRVWVRAFADRRDAPGSLFQDLREGRLSRQCSAAARPGV
jgi:hypothetical protein